MILSIKSWGTKKKLPKPVMDKYWPELQTGRFRAYIHVYQIIKNRGPGWYNFLCHANNRKYFLALSLTRNQREAHMWESGKNSLRCSCWEKGNFILISEFKYGQAWKIRPFWPLGLSLYITFKEYYHGCPTANLRPLLREQII